MEFLTTVFISPIEDLMRFIMLASYWLTQSYGVSVIILSVVVNILLLPIYFYADKLKSNEQRLRDNLAPKLNEISQVYEGREKYLLVKTLYRQHHYHPAMAMRAVVGLLLQIPFFIAAFIFLGNNPDLLGEGFLFFSDLSSPDSLFSLFGYPIHVMPLVMTLVNLLSLYFYMGSVSKAEFIQLLILPLLFLVLLYSEPVALVIYWTLNNIFSMFRHVLFQKILRKEKPSDCAEPTSYHFIPALFLSFVCFFINPLFVYFSSPDRLGELDLDWLTLCFWLSVFVTAILTKLSRGLPYFFGVLLNCLALIVLTYSYIVHVDYGLFRGDSFSDESKISSLSASVWWVELLFASVLFVFIYKLNRLKPALTSVFLSCILLVLLVDVSLQAIDHYSVQENAVMVNDLTNVELKKDLQFSRNHKNIVLFVPDAGAGYVLDSLFRTEQLNERFDGFTFYKNTVAEGTYTMSNAAALIGGKSYSPTHINAKNNQTLHVHTRESLNYLLRVLTDKKVSNIIINPAWIDCDELKNYSYCGKSSIESDLFKQHYYFNSAPTFDGNTVIAFSLFKMMPVSVKPFIYESGFWHSSLNSAAQLEASVKNKYAEYLYLRSLAEKSSVNDTDTHQFMHIWNPVLVAPFVLSKQCGVLNGEKSSIYSKRSRKNSTRCVMNALGDWFDWMKANGVYDNTKIIIAADHGAENYGYSWYKGAVNPILLVKDFDAKGGVTESSLLMQNSDVLGLICSALGGCDGVRDPIANPEKDRVATYSMTTHGNKNFLRSSKTYQIKQTFEIKGDVYEDERFKLEERSENHDSL